MPTSRRKRVRHYDFPNHVHELTFSTYRRKQLLLLEGIPEIVLGSIQNATTRHAFDVLAFVIMPEHLHLLVHPQNEKYSTPRLLSAIKRPASFRIKELLSTQNDTLLRELTIREREGKQAFRFWQAGAGYDRNLTTPDAVKKSIDYIHANPIRRGLIEKPDDWPWSSWNCLQQSAVDTGTVIVRPFHG